jgi:hypothetical protein
VQQQTPRDTLKKQEKKSGVRVGHRQASEEMPAAEIRPPVQSKAAESPEGKETVKVLKELLSETKAQVSETQKLVSEGKNKTHAGAVAGRAREGARK